MGISYVAGVLLVFAIIVIWQFRFWRASRQARSKIQGEREAWVESSSREQLDENSKSEGLAGPELLAKIKEDIGFRLRTGMQPDWQTYGQWLERFVRAQLEIIRQTANSALVLGILGTIVIAVIEIIGVAWLIENFQLDDWKLIAGILLTLGSSAIGMINNLVISQFSLRKGERDSDSFLEVAEEIVRTFANENAVPGLPDDSALAEPINRLSIRVKGLSASLEDQTKAIAEILIDQRTLVERSAESYGVHTDKIADALEKHSGQLSRLFEELNELPGLIRGAIETVPAALAEEVKKGHKHVEEVRDALTAGVSAISNEVQAGRKQMEEAAKANQDELVRHLDRYAEELGRAVRDVRLELTDIGELLEKHTRKLSDVLAEGVKEMRVFYVQNTEEVVQGIFKEHEERSRELVWKPLETLGKELGVVSSEVPNAANRFRDGVVDAAEKLAGLPDDFVAIHEGLQEIEGSLTRHQEEFIERMKSIERATNRVSQNTDELNTQIGDSVNGLIRLIQRLINEIN